MEGGPVWDSNLYWNQLLTGQHLANSGEAQLKKSPCIFILSFNLGPGQRCRACNCYSSALPRSPCTCKDFQSSDYFVVALITLTAFPILMMVYPNPFCHHHPRHIVSERQPAIGRKTSRKSSPWVARCDAACSASFAFVNLFLLILLTEVIENDRNYCYRWWEHIHQPRHWGPGWSSSSPCTAWTERSDSSTTLFSAWSVNKTTFIFWFASIGQKAGYIERAKRII